MTFQTKKRNLVIVTAIWLAGCSGGVKDNQGAGTAVSAVPSVRTNFAVAGMVAESTGIPLSRFQDRFSNREALLSPTGGLSASARTLQGVMDVVAEACNVGVIQKSERERGLISELEMTQKVIPAFISARAIPNHATNWSDSNLRNLATHLLQRFSGASPSEEEVLLLVDSIKGFLAQVRADGLNNTTGTARVLVGACVAAAVPYLIAQ